MAIARILVLSIGGHAPAFDAMVSWWASHAHGAALHRHMRIIYGRPLISPATMREFARLFFDAWALRPPHYFHRLTRSLILLAADARRRDYRSHHREAAAWWYFALAGGQEATIRWFSSSSKYTFEKAIFIVIRHYRNASSLVSAIDAKRLACMTFCRMTGALGVGASSTVLDAWPL